MTIGRHGCSICRAGRRSWSMTRARVSWCRPHASASSSYLSLTRTRWRRTMAYDPDGQLWNRRMGIRFSPPKPGPIYPQLDVSRLRHDSFSGVEVEGSGSEPLVASEQGNRLTNKSVTNASTVDEKEPQAKPVEAPSKIEPTPGNDHEKSQNSAHKVAPPFTSLAYQIAPQLFHQARGRPQGSSNSFWSHTMYRHVGEDGTKTNVKVHYCTSKHTMEYVCQKYFADEKVLGFDLEWNPWANRQMDARQNVSLIQMASPGHIGLFHCALFSKDSFVAPTFKQIMEDPGVSKVGVNIRGDCTRMRNYLGVDTRGIFELSNMYKMVKYIREGRPNLIDKVAVTLATQVQECLGLPLRKDSVRMSNWTRYLNQQQILYSAADAYAGIQLYYVLDEQRQKLDPCPPRPYHAELNLPLPIPKIDPPKAEEGAEAAAVCTEASKDTKTATKDVGKKTPTKSKFRDNRVTAADMMMQQYRSSKTGSVTVGPSALRAYYVWYSNDNLTPNDIARLLREPPLQTNTVVSYILDAVAGERMPYCKDRMKTELLSTLSPTAVKIARYQTLMSSCED